MNNLIDANEFKFYLRFNSLGRTDWYETEMPEGMDGASFEKKQEPKRFARSIEFGAIDEIKFIDAIGSYTGVDTIVNPYGDTSKHKDWGLQWLLHIYSLYGSEMDVDFKITKNNVDFRTFGLDATAPELTDGKTYFKSKLIDNSKVADYKRRAKDKLNAFATKGVFEQTVTPIETFNYLIKATPIEGYSRWRAPLNQVMFSDALALDDQLAQTFFNQIKVLEVDGIKNSLIGLTDYSNYTGSGTTWSPPLEDFKFLKARDSISNLRAKISFNLTIEVYNDNGIESHARIEAKFIKSSGDVYSQFNTANEIEVFNSPLIGTDGSLTSWSYNQVTDVDLGSLQRGFYLYFFFTQIANYKNLILKTTLHDCKIELYATSIALDTVGKACRWIDLIQQGNKMVHNVPLNASDFTFGGKYFDYAVFNRRMISQKTDYLYFDIEKIFNSPEFLCYDYELRDDELYIGQFEDYNQDEEIGAFLIVPDNGFNAGQNERLQVNKITFKNSKYATDKDLENTSNATHTESEWKVQQRKGVNSKDIKNDLVVDPFKQQEIRALEINKPTTATDDDDDLMLQAMTPLAPNSFGYVDGVLYSRRNGSYLEFLNNDGTGNDQENVIDWLLTGIGVGLTVQVIEGDNLGVFAVANITNNVLSLVVSSAFSVFTGAQYVKIKFFYQNVLYQTRTDEGFSLISGINNNVGNLSITQKRCLKEWYPYLSSFVQYLNGSNKDIINAYFKSNGNVTTQLTTETTPVIENATILSSDLPTPILSGNISNSTVVADWGDVLDYLENYKIKRGYVRLFDMVGNVYKTYIKDLKYLWVKGELTITGEDKYEIPELIIDSNLNIGGVKIGWWKIENDYFQAYDEKSRPLSKKYKYNFVILNGISYGSSELLANALNSLV